MSAWLTNSLLSHPLVQALGWTLLHFLWQGLAIGVLIGVALGLLCRQTARFRYAVACAGLVLMAGAPFGTFTILATHALRESAHDRQRSAASSDLQTPVVFDHALIVSAIDGQSQAEPGGASTVPSQQTADTKTPLATATAALAETPRVHWGLGRFQAWCERSLPWCVLLWFCGVLLLSTRLAAGLSRIGRWQTAARPVEDTELHKLLQRLTQQIRLRSHVELRATQSINVPAVVGWLRPVILVPTSMLSGLTPAEWEMILAHELAHIRRHDFLVNILQTVVETVLFYHPVVWWLSRRIRTEREHCCDDLAVAMCGNRLALARALAHMEELRCASDRFALAASGGSLLARIRRLAAADSTDRSGRAIVGTAIAATALIMAGAGWIAVVAQARAPESIGADQDPPPVAAAPTQEPAFWPANDAPFEKRKHEVPRRNSKTGVDRGVFSGIHLRSGTGNSARIASLDMMYSNLMPYSFVPARVAAELQAVQLGEIDFGEQPPPPQPQFQVQFSEPFDLLVGKNPPTPPVPEQETTPTTLTVDHVTEPVADGVRIAPYADDPVWIPGHLAFYGVNPTNQHRFQVVRIDGVDLGVGPRFGPINALVLADENSNYGVLGGDWVVQVRGDQGEGLWFYAAEGAFYFMAGGKEEKNGSDVNDEKNESEKAGLQTPPKAGDNSDAMMVTRNGHALEPERSDQPGVRVLSTHTYNLDRRQSRGWVLLNGAQVPVDDGVRHENRIVYHTLFSDIVAVDAEANQTLWSLDWNKTDPTWKTVSIVQVEWSPEIAVELYAADAGSRELIYRYVKLSDGTPLPRPVGGQAAAQESAEPLPDIKAVERDGERITRAAAYSQPGGRSAAELLQHFAAAMQRQGGIEGGGSVTNMETIVSAEKPNYLFGEAMDTPEVRFNLPEGANLRVEFSGEKIEIERRQDHVQVTVTRGRVELLDAGGVVRAQASPDGGAEQLVVDARTASGEVALVLRTQRIEPSPEYPHPPVQVKMNVATGAPADEAEPPHGAIRYEILPTPQDQPQPVRMKMKWRYDLKRLADEAQRAADSGPEPSAPPNDGVSNAPRDLVEATRALGDWLADPQVAFRSTEYLQLARELMQLDEPQRLEALRAIGAERLEGQLLALCRICFESSDPASGLRGPHRGKARFVSYDENERDFPLSPLAFVGQFPVRVVQRYEPADSEESAADYLEYCVQHGRWTTRFLAWNADELADAHRAIHHAAWWGGGLDVDEWVEVAWLRNQLEPTALLWVQAVEHVVGEFPSRSLNREFPVEPETVVAELQQHGYSPEAQLLFVCADSAQAEWIASLLRPLAAAGYRKVEFVCWQQSPDPVPMPDVEKLLSVSADEWGPQPPDSSLRLKLSALDPQPKVGEPLRLKLEIKNFGDHPQQFDPQYYFPFRALRATGADGQTELFIGMTPQTSGGPVELKPGESHVLWASVDAADLFLLEEGRVDLQVNAPKPKADQLPSSNVLQIEILAGEQPPLKRLLRALADQLPEHWRVSQFSGNVTLFYSPTNLKRETAEISIWFTPIPRDGSDEIETRGKHKTVTTLGHCELRWAHLAADERVQTVWPAHVDAIREAFSAAELDLRSDGPPTNQPVAEPMDQAALPWQVSGTVTNEAGKPLADVEIIAHCGMGTLRQTGSTRTDTAGTYVLRFGPGILLEDRHSLQMATISVRYPGHFEKNLHRQGDLIAALEKPKGEIGWGDKKHENLVLPDQPKELNFVMLPATRLKGTVLDAAGRRAAGVRVSLTGDQLPPSTSVLAEVRTDEQGEFAIEGVPTGYAFQVLVAPATAAPPWLAWASPPLEFLPGSDDGQTHVRYLLDDRQVDFSFPMLHLLLHGEGVTWKTALAEAAKRPLELKWDGLSTDQVVRAGMAFLVLR